MAAAVAGDCEKIRSYTSPDIWDYEGRIGDKLCDEHPKYKDVQKWKNYW